MFYLIWIRTTQGVGHMTTQSLEEGPLVLLSVEDHLEGVAPLPEVLPADDGHQVVVGDRGHGRDGARRGHHRGVAVIRLVDDVHQPPHSVQVDHSHKLQ